jgi:hypothetical protein
MMPVYEHATIKIGTTITLSDLHVAKAVVDVQSDAVGLLPPALFRRVYISHSGKFIVLNPAPPKKSSQGLDVEEAEASER